MRTIIAGSRGVFDRTAINEAMDAAALIEGIEPTLILSGLASGVDSLGEEWAIDHGIPVALYPAPWRTHREAAGAIRNGHMARNADALVAVWDGVSPGTRDMIEQARRRGLLVYVHLAT